MLNNILNSLVQILRGKNGGIFLIIAVVVLVLFLTKILKPLLWLLIFGGIAVWVFNKFEKKS